jgi:hypothetical protein
LTQRGFDQERVRRLTRLVDMRGSSTVGIVSAAQRRPLGIEWTIGEAVDR